MCYVHVTWKLEKGKNPKSKYTTKWMHIWSGSQAWHTLPKSAGCYKDWSHTSGIIELGNTQWFVTTTTVFFCQICHVSTPAQHQTFPDWTTPAWILVSLFCNLPCVETVVESVERFFVLFCTQRWPHIQILGFITPSVNATTLLIAHTRSTT